MNQPIKVLQILEATVGGTRRHLVSLMAGIDKEQFAVEIAAPRLRQGTVNDTSFVDEITALGIPLHVVDLQREIGPRADLWALLSLIRLISRHNYDLIHTHSSKAGFLGRLAAKFMRRPVIYTPHGFYFLDAQDPRKQQLFLRLEQFAGRLTDCLIAVSESERQVCLQHRIGNPSRIKTITNGIDCSLFQPNPRTRQQQRASLLIPEDAPVVGIVARFIAQKDPLSLVHAAHLVLQQRPDTRFVWCGEGNLRDVTERLALKLDIHSKFHFLGFRQDVGEIMNSFDLFILASLFEGLPYTLLEAMALGLPIVATDVVGNRDIVHHQETGLLVEPQRPSALASAILDLLCNKDKRERLARAGRQMVREHYDVAQMVRQIEALYCSLANSSAGMVSCN
jgi:glycosyltransferase involved in cell wall biosynthesis